MNKMMGVMIAAALACASLPAEAREKEATTPSGRPEMVFGYTALSDAVAQVQSKCMDKGWMVSSQTNNQVVCEIPMGIFQAALTQMLVGNKYSTTPKMFTRFSLGQVGEHTRVQTQTWAETQMAFGQMQQQAYNDDGTYNNMLGFLAESGAQFPIGTTFTSRAYLAIRGEDATWMNGRRSAFGHRLTQVTVNGPAHRMGARQGDIVAKINNRTFRDEEGLGSLLNRQRVGEAISLTVIRDGEEVALQGVAEGRPTTTVLVDPRIVPPGETAVGMQIAVGVFGSVAAAQAEYARTIPGYVVPSADKAALVEVASEPETDLARMRREAAEAQERLAEAERAVAANPAQ